MKYYWICTLFQCSAWVSNFAVCEQSFKFLPYWISELSPAGCRQCLTHLGAAKSAGRNSSDHPHNSFFYYFTLNVLFSITLVNICISARVNARQNRRLGFQCWFNGGKFWHRTGLLYLCWHLTSIVVALFAIPVFYWTLFEYCVLSIIRFLPIRSWLRTRLGRSSHTRLWGS